MREEGAVWRDSRAWLSPGVPRAGVGARSLISLSVQFTTTVVSCRPAELQTEGSNGKKEVLSGFHVVLKDTLLFPEGGGQVTGTSFPPLPSHGAPNSFLCRWKMVCCSSVPQP